jgi:uncharacterized membrane protein YfcA
VHGLVLVGVGIWCFVVALVGGLLGLVLGNIRLPVLLLVGSNPAAAAGANIAISGLAAATASVTHIRAGRVHWRLVAWMLPPSVVGAVAGAYAAGRLPDQTLRLVIGGTLLVFGADLLRRRNTAMPAPREKPDIRAAVITGAVVGAIGGLIGLILSTLRVPALIRWVGEDHLRAIGTNLVVGVAVGAAGLLGHLPTGVDWTLLAVGAGASIPGALIGSHFTGRLSAPALLRAIGVILLVSGTIVIVRAVL